MFIDDFAYNNQVRHPEHELDGATAPEPPETPLQRTFSPLPSLLTSTPHISFLPVTQAYYTPTSAHLWAPYEPYPYLYSSSGPSILQTLYYLLTQAPTQAPPYVESSNKHLQNQRGKEKKDTLKVEK
ncbi:unnamed protein product [Cyclocybe aegerita]|uniref:Uncharacterized protein n=1 Tax=Cyclocybe aegerita TaxID=1973307 RepID=A0A8S0W352_CYCAE|nr:unnamed protein product [Cyclocybe aegerita]